MNDDGVLAAKLLQLEKQIVFPTAMMNRQPEFIGFTSTSDYSEEMALRRFRQFIRDHEYAEVVPFVREFLQREKLQAPTIALIDKCSRAFTFNVVTRCCTVVVVVVVPQCQIHNLTVGEQQLGLEFHSCFRWCITTTVIIVIQHNDRSRCGGCRCW